MKNTIITIVALLVLLVIALYGYQAIFKKPLGDTNTDQEEVRLPSVDIKEQYKDGKFTFVGTIQTPTPCHTVSSEAVEVADNKYEIQVTTIAPSSDVMCAQVISDKDYKVTFETNQDSEITAVINGVEYELNRYEVPLGENIDTYELFIKG